MPITAAVQTEIANSPARTSTEIGLNQMRQAATVAGHLGPIVGAYRLTKKYWADIDSSVKRLAEGAFCSTPHYINLHVQVERTLYIPSEFASDDCLSKLARDHEGKHAQAQDKVIDQLRPGLESAINSAMRRAPRSPAGSETLASATLNQEIAGAIDGVLNRFETERAELNAAVDTPDELNRVKRACEGRANQD